MKRIASYNKKLEELDAKRHELRLKIDTKIKELINIEKERSLSEQQRFLHNAQIRRIPILRSNRVSVAPESGPNLVDLLDYKDISLLVLDHLGPLELAMFSRTCPRLYKTTTDAFLVLAPGFLERYVPKRYFDETNSDRAIQVREIVPKMKNLITKQIEDRTASLGQLLRIWYQFLDMYRDHDPVDFTTRRDRRYDQHIVFVYNRETGSYTPASQLNLFKMHNYKKAKIEFEQRWADTGLQMPENIVPYFNYSELSKASLAPLGHVLTLSKKILLIEPDQPYIELVSNLRLVFCSFLLGYQDDSPLVDHYEARVIHTRAVRLNASRDCGHGATNPFRVHSISLEERILACTPVDQ